MTRHGWPIDRLTPTSARVVMLTIVGALALAGAVHIHDAHAPSGALILDAPCADGTPHATRCPACLVAASPVAPPSQVDSIHGIDDVGASLRDVSRPVPVRSVPSDVAPRGPPRT